MGFFTATVAIDESKRSATLAVAGELDHASNPELARNLAIACAALPERLRVDLSGVTSCDATGLRTFVAASELCKFGGVTFEAVGASPYIAKALTAAGFADIVGASEPLSTSTNAREHRRNHVIVRGRRSRRHHHRG